MLIRIFAVPSPVLNGLTKYINFLRLEQRGHGPWNVEYCDPTKWTPSRGDVHIYIDTPVRLAVPWASYNVYAADTVFDMWNWVHKEMDLVISTKSLLDRASAIHTFRRIFRLAVKDGHPPALPLELPTPLPKVGIITVTRNRKPWWLNMLQSVVKQDWPVSRLEWIIVDDGDEGQRIGPEVEEFMEKSPGLVLRYVEMTKPQSIGAKRNAAVEAAGADVDVFVVMDDDDHYPKNSIKLRVGWLNRAMPLDKETKIARPQSQVGYCSVLPMYDLTRYISAMNVPEMELGPAERVSEATLVFTRAAWTDRPFPDVSMAEGLGFLEGREGMSVEMTSKDMIVSFIHTKNSSSRRIPPEQEPNGCHYGFADEFFRYVHEIGMAKQT
jgi:hypothetical protein